MQSEGMRHYSARNRTFKKLEPFPHPKALGRVLDHVMPVIALGGPIALLPQVFQILALKDASDMSLATWLLWELFSFVWLLYGIVHKELPIILANSVYLVLQAVVIIAIFVY